MPFHFLEELTVDREEALNHCLRLFDLNKLLSTLYEFIETYLKHSPFNEKEWPYVECLLSVITTLMYELNSVYADTLKTCTFHTIAMANLHAGCYQNSGHMPEKTT